MITFACTMLTPKAYKYDPTYERVARELGFQYDQRRDRLMGYLAIIMKYRVSESSF